jgi:hypothetical protein
MLREITKDEYIKGIINNVEEDEKDIRQRSKSPFFLLNYQGSYIGLSKKYGLFADCLVSFSSSSTLLIMPLMYSSLVISLNIKIPLPTLILELNHIRPIIKWAGLIWVIIVK